MILSILIISTILAVQQVIALEAVPDYLHICQRNDPELQICMIHSIEELRPRLAVGIPELDIPKLEPLDLGDLLVSERSTGNGITITAKAIRAFGSSDFSINSLEVVEYGKNYKFEISLPHLFVKGKYVLDGQILLLPIKGSGKFTGNFTRCIADVKIFADKTIIKGETHTTVKKLEIKIKVGKGLLNLENLFGGDKVLSDVINETINQNFETVSHDIIPLIERSLEKHFKKTANKIMGRYTEKQLFP